MRPVAAALAATLATALASPAVAQTPVTVKLATLAPEGSSWMKLFREWQKNIETRTEGRVKIKIYGGGIQGDEKDVLRKVRLGQLAGGAVTAIGLAQIDPEVRALEVARTYEELDYARAGLEDILRKKFEEKGYILLGWGDVGPVHLFSKKPVKTLADLQSLRLWMWSDDPITRELLTALGVDGVPLGVPEVLPGLSTGQIDSFFSSPLATVALQWTPHARYVSSMVMGQATGATVVAKKVWDQIGAPDQAIILEESKRMEKLVLTQVRKDNTTSLRRLQELGVELVPTPPALEKELQRRATTVAEKAGASFSKEFQERVRTLIEKARASHP